ncbi:MAG: sigma-70 family RNA polymerase sigma factor [Phycisphaerae bacterium]|jgi:RNA polymerase sigma-70 factor (ECF subfamily)|nr:sigma-70 family RNA polymerase sigma factor [Phycisphaerae bacterium]
MTGPPDGLTELQNRLIAGDTQVLADFFDLHRERLWRMVNFRLSSKLRGRISPDDVIQQAYLEAAKRIEHCRKESSPFVWIRMIVRQTLTDIHRRHLGAQKRDAGREVAINRPNYAHTTAASLAMQLVGDWTSPSQAAARGEKMNIVQDAIENMDPIDREVLALRHFEELTNSEVAEELDIQPKTASIRYIRALQRLRSILSDLPGLVDGNTNV